MLGKELCSDFVFLLTNYYQLECCDYSRGIKCGRGREKGGGGFLDGFLGVTYSICFLCFDFFSYVVLLPSGNYHLQLKKWLKS